MTAPPSDWDIFDFIWITEWNLTKLDRKQDLNVFHQFCQKTKMATLASDGRDIFNYSPTAESNSTKLDGKQDFNVLYQVCIFRIDKKNNIAALAVFSATFERNSMKLDRKQGLNNLYQDFVFQADRNIKMAALASDWLGHFSLLCNCWTEFNETWQGGKISTSSTKFVFFRPIGKLRSLLCNC